MHGVAQIPGGSPEWFPYVMDWAGDTVSFIHLQPDDYRNASFLDQRLLTPRTTLEVIPWQKALAAMAALPLLESCAFIFHIGHVGSTLLSRLIGAHPDALSLREPLLLRLFAQQRLAPAKAGAAATVSFDASPIELRLSASLKLLSRTYHARQLAVVKATSFVSDMAADLIGRRHAPKAILMLVSPETYLATIFGGPNSRHEARVMAPSRLQRLHRRIGREVWRLDRLTEGEVLALAWVCEVIGLATAANERTWCLDFDRFLAAPAPLLQAAFRHLGIPATSRDLEDILGGPLLRTYSKAPEHAYDLALRNEVLNDARAQHPLELRRGLQWLERAADDFTVVRQAVEFARAAQR